MYCKSEDLHLLNEKITNKFNTSSVAQLTWKSDNNVNVANVNAEKLFKLLNVLEENEDVQNVYSNFEVSEDTLKRLTA